jgi:anti-sigma B factor antagonist
MICVSRGPVTHTVRDGEHVVTVTHDLDVVTAPLAEAAAFEAIARHPARLVFDLSTVEFIDSIGLRSVMRIRVAAEEHRCPLGVLPPPASVHKVFEITGLAESLPWIEQRDLRHSPGSR